MFCFLYIFQNLEKVFKHRDLKEQLLETKLQQANMMLKEAEEKHKLQKEHVRQHTELHRKKKNLMLAHGTALKCILYTSPLSYIKKKHMVHQHTELHNKKIYLMQHTELHRKKIYLTLAHCATLKKNIWHVSTLSYTGKINYCTRAKRL